MPHSRRSRWFRSALFLALMIPLYGQDCCSDQVSNDPCRAFLEQGGLCQLVADRTNDFDPCPLTGGGSGWCYNGDCVTASLCWPGKCYDGVECTVDACDPADGTCSNTVDPEAFLSCDNGNGVCVGSACDTTDPCLREGYGRINCCSDTECLCPRGDCSGSVDVASDCPNPLPVNSDCDPTGVEAPGASPNQAGHCVASGECVWDSGPCADEECKDQFDCTMESCDPTTGSCRPSEPIGPGLQCDAFGGFCAGSACRIDGCVEQGGFTECCEDCDNGQGFCDFEDFEGSSCTPGTRVSGEGDGICVVTPASGRFRSRCVPAACAVPDPDDQVPDGSPPGWIEKNCDDGLPCTDDSCDPETGGCVNTLRPEFSFCDDGFGVCLSDGSCAELADPCNGAGALCHPCTEQGILDAIAAGGGPHEFACSGQRIVLGTTLVVDNDVILDGEGVLTLEGARFENFVEVRAGVTAEIRGVTFDDGRTLVNDGNLTLVDTVTSDGFSPIQNNGTLTVVRGVFTRNFGLVGGVIVNDGSLNITDSSFFDNSVSRLPSGSGGAGAIANYGMATITGTTISGNDADWDTGSDDRAGGIYNSGTLTLVGSSVVGNITENNGGGIVTAGGTLALQGSTVASNQATGEGGGIYAGNASQVFIEQSSLIEDNNAGTIGGGMRVFNAAAFVIDSTVQGNIAATVGGGLASFGNSGGPANLSVLRSTIGSNTANVGAGLATWAVDSTLTTLTVEDSALIGNTASATGGGVWVGAGTTASLTNSTIAQNSSGNEGGGVHVFGSQADIVHCTFEDNTSAAGGDAIGLFLFATANVQNSILADDCSEPVASLGGNLELDTDTCGLGAGDAIVASSELNLGDLALHGGPTVNYLPMTGSTAIDFAACVPGVTTEQRGINTRPQGPLCDSGSVERP